MPDIRNTVIQPPPHDDVTRPLDIADAYDKVLLRYLAILPTSMAEQAAKVYELTIKHNGIHLERWWNVRVNLEDREKAGASGPSQYQSPSEQATIDALERSEEDMSRSNAQPRNRSDILSCLLNSFVMSGDHFTGAFEKASCDFWNASCTPVIKARVCIRAR